MKTTKRVKKVKIAMQYHKSDYKFDKDVIGQGYFRTMDNYAKSVTPPRKE